MITPKPVQRRRDDLPLLFAIRAVLATVSFVSSLLLLHFLLDSWNPSGLIQKLGMNGVTYGQITASIYLKVSVSDFLALFSARTRDCFFWKIKPGPLLLAGGIVALSLSPLLSIVWPDSEQGHNIPASGLHNNMGLFGFVWIYCLVFWLIQDIAKVLFYPSIKRCTTTKSTVFRPLASH